MPSFGSEAASRLKRSRAFLHGRQDELKYRAARIIRLRPQPAAVAVDDRPADRQPHSDSTGLCGVERLEDSFDLLRINARPRIPHLDEHAAVILYEEYFPFGATSYYAVDASTKVPRMPFAT